VFLTLGTILLVAAYAFWKKVWGRHVAAAYMGAAAIAPFFLMPNSLDAGCASTFFLPFIGATLWYFYAKRTVVQYYAHLARAQQHR
jgi:hypothetical protein